MSESKPGSATERYRALLNEAEKFRSEATAEALGRMEAARKDLEQLGHIYTVTEMAKAESQASHPSGQTRRMRDSPCSICHFKTNPPHDGRKHRAQSLKKPFTSAELIELGFEKIAQ